MASNLCTNLWASPAGSPKVQNLACLGVDRDNRDPLWLESNEGTIQPPTAAHIAVSR